MHKRTFVVCPSCGEEHFTDTLDFLNIEEGMMGEDRLTYICPETEKMATATVFASC